MSETFSRGRRCGSSRLVALLCGLAVVFAVSCGAAAPAAVAQARAPSGREIKVGGLALSLPDAELLDQDGRRVRFYSDLIKGRVVILSFFYTSCEYVCALQGGNFSQLQQKLGDRLGRDVHLLLVTRDPAVDTPRRLKAWGEKYGVRPGWTLLTGRAEEVDRVIAALTGDRIGQAEAHSSGIYLGNDATRTWTYTSGLTPADTLVESLGRLTKPAPEE